MALPVHKCVSSHAQPATKPPSQNSSRPCFSFFLKGRILILCVFLVLVPLSFIITYPLVGLKAGFFYPSALRHPFLVKPNHALSFPVLNFLERKHFNETLLALARVNLAEPAERQQINSILDGTWQNRRRYGTQHWDDYGGRYRTRGRFPRSRTYNRDRRMPLQLASPRFEPYWPAFRSSLQAWVSNNRHEPQIMKELLHLVKDPIDKHYMEWKNSTGVTPELGKPYRTCAVVGNSGIMLNQSQGALIDSHDMVMRLNNARITGFEQHVGSKTTLSFVNSNILHDCERRNNCFCHPYGIHVPLIMYICQVVHFMDVTVCGAKHQAPIIITDARFDTLCAQIVKYYSLKMFVETSGRQPEEWSNAHEGTLFHYSSGMQAVLLAVGICDRVSIFGFGKSETARHHYHSMQRAELSLHDYLAEYQLYMDLATRNPELVPFLNEAGFSIPFVKIYW